MEDNILVIDEIRHIENAKVGVYVVEKGVGFHPKTKEQTVSEKRLSFGTFYQALTYCIKSLDTGDFSDLEDRSIRLKKLVDEVEAAEEWIKKTFRCEVLTSK